MPSNPDHHNRHSIRLREYDYAQFGAYFVTVCTQQKQSLFGEIVDGVMHLNALGEIVAECWTAIPQHFPNVELDEWVVMPNHLHGIIVITDSPGASSTIGEQHPSGTPSGRAAPLHDAPQRLLGQMKSGSLSVIVRSFKSAATKGFNAAAFAPGERFWQRNYYEHIVRDESDLNRIRGYIANNPSKWGEDRENPQRIQSS